MDDDCSHERWMVSRDERFTMALVLDVTEALSRHGYPPPTGAPLVALTVGLYRALHGDSTLSG